MNRQEALSGKRTIIIGMFSMHRTILLPFVAGMEEPIVVTLLLHIYVSCGALCCVPVCLNHMLVFLRSSLIVLSSHLYVCTPDWCHWSCAAGVCTSVYTWDGSHCSLAKASVFVAHTSEQFQLKITQ